MNPGAELLAYWRAASERERALQRAHNARLHAKAVERRKKRKRGGKK